MLDQIQKSNDIFYDTYQRDHLKKLETFEKDVREYKEFIMKNSPIKSGLEGELEASKNWIKKFVEGLKDIKIREEKMQFGFQLFNIDYIPVPEIRLIKEQIEKL
jgi:hypothetical protein